MLSAKYVLAWATAVANEWTWLAIAWHVALAVAAIGLFRGWRPMRRRLGALLILPIFSTALVAGVSRNPFNALTFLLLAVVLAGAVRQMPPTPVTPARSGWPLAGWALLGFGWLYPHFLSAETWTAYAYASPFGLLPCPTLSVVIGATLIFGGLGSVQWSAPLLVAGLLYGVIGVLGLGVYLDLWLIGGALLGLGRLRYLADSTDLRGFTDGDQRTASSRRSGVPSEQTFTAGFTK